MHQLHCSVHFVLLRQITIHDSLRESEIWLYGCHTSDILIFQLQYIKPLQTLALLVNTFEKFVIFSAFNNITCTGRPTQKSSPWCCSFVTLMIIYNSQVACLCGPHLAAAWRLRLPCIFGKQYHIGVSIIKKEREFGLGEMYANAESFLMTLLLLTQFQIIMFACQPIASTALCHKYWPLVVPEKNLSSDLPTSVWCLSVKMAKWWY